MLTVQGFHGLTMKTVSVFYSDSSPNLQTRIAAAKCGSAVVCSWRSQSVRWKLMSSMSWLNSPLNSTALTTIINEACYKLKIT